MASTISPTHSRRQRRSGGHNTIELACVLVAFAIVTVLAIDIGIICLANSTNDTACRDAARAAAQGSNYASALRLAQSAIRQHSASSTYFGAPTIDGAEFVYEDFGGSPPPNTSPFVSVTTTMNVRVPAPVNFAGAHFYPSDGTTQVRKTYDFPIVKTQLYLR